MYESLVVLGCVGVAGGLGIPAYRLARRRAHGWSSTVDVEGGMYRGGQVRVATTEPHSVRLVAAAAVLAAGVSLIRGGLAIGDDFINIVDQAHIETGLTPREPWLAIHTVLYALVSLGAIAVFLRGAWIARRPEGARRGLVSIAAVAVLPFAFVDAWLIAKTCGSIYWLDRMVAASIGHGLLLVPAVVFGVLSARAGRAAAH